MDKELKTIDLRRILALDPSIDEHEIGSDFVLGEGSGRIADSNTKLLEMLRYPIRFDGYIIFFLRKGHMKADINLKTYDIRENSILISVPGNIIKVYDIREESPKDNNICFALISREFMSSIRVDFQKVYQDSLRMLDNPCFQLNPAQTAIAGEYATLAKSIIDSPIQNKREIMGGLLSSFIFMAMDIWKGQAEQMLGSETDKNTPRINILLERFLALVSEYHTSERGMAFYAEKLYLTPKYLSKLIKCASGRSGPEWIDDYVILEAKNLLKYSDLSIKEIVYHLHFPNQSVFYKFFKAHTGQTPSEYRKG